MAIRRLAPTQTREAVVFLASFGDRTNGLAEPTESSGVDGSAVSGGVDRSPILISKAGRRSLVGRSIAQFLAFIALYGTAIDRRSLMNATKSEARYARRHLPAKSQRDR
jgi:hypothetical protein